MIIRIYMKLKIELRALLIAAVSMVAGIASGQNSSGTWKIYTSMDCTPKKIMAGDRYTYFWVNQGYFAGDVTPLSSSGCIYGTPLGGVLYYDKEQPALGIRSIHERGEINPTAVMHASYNAAGKYLLLTFANNGIEILTDEGTIHHINDLRDTHGAESLEVQSVTFSLADNDAWISTTTGMIRIDGSTFRIKNRMRTNQPVYSMCQIGDRILACIGSDLYYAKKDTPLVSLSEFTKLDRTLPNPKILMPLEGDMCAVMYDGTSPSKMGVVKVETGKTPVMTAGLISQPGLANRLQNKPAPYNYGDANKIWRDTKYYTDYENNYLSQSDGYIFFTGNQATWVDKTPTAAGEVSYTTVTLPQSDVFAMGSKDFDNFWFYDFRKGFRQDTRSGSSWNSGSNIVPDAPAPAGGMTLRYSPQYGMICETKRMNWNYLYGMDRLEAMLISGYKNGHWTNYSPSHVVPESIESNVTLLEQYNKYNGTINTYPITTPWDMDVDPAYPDYVWSSNWFDGVVAQNLGNPKGDLLHFGVTRSAYINKQFPGFKASLPNGWAPYAHLAGFDGDGTLLVYASLEDGTTKPRLYYLTAEDRKNGLESQDISAIDEFKHLDLNIPSTGWAAKALALKHEKNKGKLILDPGDWETFYIYDYKGTITDPSDDEVYLVKSLVGPEGERYCNDRGFSWTEDPLTGDVYLGTSSALFKLDVTKPVTNSCLPCEVVTVMGDGSHKEIVVPNTCAEAVCFDEYNRMWIGLQCGGVIGINADRSKIIARYDMTNSRMPSNTVYGLCWNPETKELFISTKTSLCSVKPDVEPESKPLDNILEAYAYPANVTPDYAGAVNLFNIPDHSILTVYDRDGNRVKALAGSVDYHAVWNLDNEEGMRVESGMYLVKDATGMIPDIEIFVMK